MQDAMIQRQQERVANIDALLDDLKEDILITTDSKESQMIISALILQRTAIMYDIEKQRSEC